MNFVCADAVAWCNAYEGPLFHGLLSDTPYNLESITKRFGKNGSAPARPGTDGAFVRASKGFMNQDWDTDIAFQVSTWEAFRRVLHPGAFGFAFSGSRTWHRMAVAIEDAGLIIHPTIFLWAFGSGFPKATRIKDAAFEGHRYGAQALKPAVEPIICFQKPYEGKPQENITQTGAGALHIEDARILSGKKHGGSFNLTAWRAKEGRSDVPPIGPRIVDTKGRWPANFILSHSPDCTDERCAPGCPVQTLNEQGGDRPAGSDLTGSEPSQPMNGDVYSGRTNRHEWQSYADNGGAARFFHNADWSYEVQEQIDNADAVYYSAKVGYAEREAGLTHLDEKTINDGREKSIDNPYQRGQTIRHNNGPCLKPIELTRYLATMLLPPSQYAPRRILNPFGGTGSEAIGAGLAGWEEVTSIELKQDYHDIAKLRWEFWKTRIAPPKIARKDKTNPGQLTLF